VRARHSRSDEEQRNYSEEDAAHLAYSERADQP
jgi:hypothetical protein